MRTESDPTHGTIFYFGTKLANRTPLIQSIFIIYFREHNRRARYLKLKCPSCLDEGLYQRARKWTIAVHQKVTYEYSLSPYNISLDSICHYFSETLFELIQTMIALLTLRSTCSSPRLPSCTGIQQWFVPLFGFTL
jgi:hypothetical protein